jgi:hypothetical protein
MLASLDLDQLRQRVLASYHLGPLSREETRAYIEHRLTTVGWHGAPRWDDAAFAAVHNHSGGIPRRINRLCGRVLLFGALEQSTEITGPMVGSTADELAEDIEGVSATRLAQLSESFAAPSLGAEHSGGLDLLNRRVQALEEQMARRERVFQQFLDGLGGGLA